MGDGLWRLSGRQWHPHRCVGKRGGGWHSGTVRAANLLQLFFQDGLPVHDGLHADRDRLHARDARSHRVVLIHNSGRTHKSQQFCDYCSCSVNNEVYAARRSCTGSSCTWPCASRESVAPSPAARSC
ncbi:uncharacterized protein ACA1_244520 [Acanthamoeba castellanii str. Neff]|uniref:Uncharacterized protein n=1 Tax=Acanthamoeba castellanii (strain ATCC 30010 / Neff) TaxID=1257118 RepID=L8GK57_ACACF|nr:uncharacterized protein ACA1_244520 [Acanthamoeba castellanii str. Neff]ELR13422.1 hypothetical protein ACA1_244520 [Acanthamoeba castellanii str. Neff]